MDKTDKDFEEIKSFEELFYNLNRIHESDKYFDATYIISTINADSMIDGLTKARSLALVDVLRKKGFLTAKEYEQNGHFQDMGAENVFEVSAKKLIGKLISFLEKIANGDNYIDWMQFNLLVGLANEVCKESPVHKFEFDNDKNYAFLRVGGYMVLKGLTQKGIEYAQKHNALPEFPEFQFIIDKYAFGMAQTKNITRVFIPDNAIFIYEDSLSFPDAKYVSVPYKSLSGDWLGCLKPDKFTARLNGKNIVLHKLTNENINTGKSYNRYKNLPKELSMVFDTFTNLHSRQDKYLMEYPQFASLDEVDEFAKKLDSVISFNSIASLVEKNHEIVYHPAD